MKPDVFIVGGARTPMTEYVGAPKDVSALELGAIAARGAFEKTGVKPEWVALKAGVPIEVWNSCTHCKFQIPNSEFQILRVARWRFERLACWVVG